MSDEPATIAHAIGRYYQCANNHVFDRVSAKDPSVSPYPPEKSCPQCGQAAPVKFDTKTHTTTEKCPFGQCPNPPQQ